ncbi:MAG: peptidase S10 [Verrucomicrobia bacterium]|nr:peptidase S10 [Verrucomicrobiota bacterium]
MRKIWIALLSLTTVCADEPISTSHEIELPSGKLEYTATVGSLPTYDPETGEVLGSIGYTAYTTGDPSRPITFAFNGGPGSSSFLLHMCAMGPKRVLSPFEGQPTSPPYEFITNEATLLEETDLVFVDPMSTGLSRPAPEKDPFDFYHSENDALSLSEFIRDYITNEGRWNSPKYVAGESYGTFRACTMARYLQGTYGIHLNGLILISCALDYQTLVFDYDNPLPYFLFLPTYAATAWFHGLAHEGKTIEQVAEEARVFAYEKAAPYYIQPYRYSTEQKKAMWREMAALTGLPYEEFLEENGRITEDTYLKRLFFRKCVGRYDTTVVGDRCPNGHCMDPSALCIDGSTTALLNHYLTQELGAEISFPVYNTFSEESFRNWQWPRYRYFGYPTSLDALREAMIMNPSLKIYIGNGYYDIATPYAATEHSIASLDLPDAYSSNLQMEYYEGGHMYYLHPPALKKFKSDLVKFYANSQH